jgi:hypothetical protein
MEKIMDNQNLLLEKNVMKKLIIGMMFNNRNIDKNELNKDWIDYRLKIFQKYTMKSLINQTNQDFVVLMGVRKETIDYVKSKLDAPDNIKIRDSENTINKLIKGYEYLYILRLDSDDCFINNWIERIHNYKPKEETEILISQYCYNYDINTKRLMKFFLDSPQCYSLIYKVEDYCKGKKYKLPGGHNGAITLKHELLKGYNYMDTVHDKNISSRFWEKSKGRLKLHGEVIEVTEKKKILQDFGVNL